MLPMRAFVLGLAVSLACSIAVAQEADDSLADLVINLLHEKDSDLRALGFEQVRTEVKGAAATRRFAAELPKLPAEAQVGLLRALADRADKAARPAVLSALSASSDPTVRLAAIAALGPLGQREDLPVLVRHLADGSKEEKAVAHRSLVRLQGDQMASAIVGTMNDQPAGVRVALIGILVERRAVDATDDLLRLALDPDSAVRQAAIAALGQLAGPQQIPGMVQALLKAENSRERDAAERAITLVAGRIPDRDQQAAPLLAVMEKLNPTERDKLLPALGRIGGPQALEIVQAAVASNNRERHEAGVRGLCNWPNASVAPQLIELSTHDNHPSDRSLALAALIRVAPLPDGRADPERLALVKEVMAMCRTDQQRNLLLKRAAAVRSIETLRFLLPYLEQPAHADQARESIVELAHHRGLREPNKAEFHRALDRVIATSKDPVIIDRAKRYKADRTWVRPATNRDEP
jgi:HEAT repeat protein